MPALAFLQMGPCGPKRVPLRYNHDKKIQNAGNALFLKYYGYIRRILYSRTEICRKGTNNMVQKEVQTPEAVSFFDKLKSVFGAVYPENAQETDEESE